LLHYQNIQASWDNQTVAVQATKANRVSNAVSSLILNIGTKSTSQPERLTHGKELHYSL